METRISARASIVQNAKFESAIAKLQLALSDSLERDERAEVSSFLVSGQGHQTDEDEDLSFAERALKREAYLYQQLVLPRHQICRTTLNACKQLLSLVSHLLNNH
eukprot:IDg10131t1